MCINFQVDGTDDKAEYVDTMDAMTTMGMDDDEKSDLIMVVTGEKYTQYHVLKHKKLYRLYRLRATLTVTRL